MNTLKRILQLQRKDFKQSN